MADGNTETPEHQIPLDSPDFSNPELNIAQQKPKQPRKRLPHEQPQTTAFQSAFDLTDHLPTPEIPEPIVETKDLETTIQTPQEPEVTITSQTVEKTNEVQTKQVTKTKKALEGYRPYCEKLGHGKMIPSKFRNGFWCPHCRD